MTSFVDDNGNYLDYGGFDFSITKQVASIYEFKIKGDVSVNFELPNTSTNRKALGYYGITQTNNPAFSKNAFNIIRNGNFFMRGYLAIYDEANDKSNVLHCFFISGNANWIQTLDFNLKELENEIYTIAYTETSINTQSSKTSGIIFPVVDYNSYYSKGTNTITLFPIRAGTGTDSVLFPLNPEDYYSEMMPCVYVSTLIKEISRETGIKFQGNVLTDKLYERLILTHDGADVVNPETFISKRRAKIKVGAAQSIGTTGTITKVNFDTLVSQGSKGLYASSKWTADAKYRVKFNVYISVNNSQAYTIYIYKNGSSVISNALTGGTELIFEYYLDVVAGDYLEIYINNPSSTCIISTSSRWTVAPSDLSVLNATQSTNYIRLPMVAPSMKAIELVKWLAVTFGAECIFDVTANTLTLTKIDTITDSEDWTQYWKGDTFFYNKITQNNYVRLPSANEPEIADYNEANLVGYGELNIQSQSELGGDTDVYTSPFGSVKDAIGLTKNKMLLSFIQDVELSDDLGVTYTTVSDNSGTDANRPIQFNGSGWPFGSQATGLIVRIADDKGHYSGYFVTDTLNTASATALRVNGGSFVETSTGTIYVQKLTKKNPGVRALICIPSANVSDFSNQTVIKFQDASNTSRSTVAWAFYSKPVTGYPCDNIPGSLNFGDITVPGYNDPSLKDQYYSKISKFFQNPFGKVQMLLPESVFANYNFTKFVYNSEINRYFFVHSIENYKDSTSECTVYLLMI